MATTELKVLIQLEDYANIADGIEAFASFQPYEETHLTGLRHLVVYLEPLAAPLKGLLEFIKTERDRRMVGAMEIKLGPDKSIRLERFDIEKADDLSALAEELAKKLKDQ